MTNQYRYGRLKEELVARSLRGRGASVDLSPGSKGAYDLQAFFPSGTDWLVQVKATRSGNPKDPSPKDIGRLKQTATKRRATAVIANVSGNTIEFVSARTGRKLSPPKSK